MIPKHSAKKRDHQWQSLYVFTGICLYTASDKEVKVKSRILRGGSR